MKKIMLFMASLVVSLGALASETIIINKNGVSVISSNPKIIHGPVSHPRYAPVHNSRQSERERIKHYKWCEHRNFRGRECSVYRNGKRHSYKPSHPPYYQQYEPYYNHPPPGYYRR